ncbi:MAG: PAS domain S-box protein [Prosthecobacter sp.]|uniref:PAS domain-containing protein n=1 Tax=Prosthecobacter sp. TaxID=1965333 RepID=UPI003BB1B32B
MKRAASKKAKAVKSAKKRTSLPRANQAATRSKAHLPKHIQDRTDAVKTAELMTQMQEQQDLLELRNEQLGEANADLELSRHRYADLYNLAPVGYVTLDAKGCIREINHTAAELLGYTITHLMGRPMMPYLAKPDRKVFLQHLWECRRAGHELCATLHLATKDKGERLTEFTTHPAQDFDSKPGWCRTAIMDVTERRGIEAALSASEAKFRLLAENMGEVFWFMELDPPRVTYVSPAFENIWGMPASELYADSKVWMKAVHAEDLPAVDAAFQSWLAGETDTYQIEYRILNREGEIHWIMDRGIIIGRRDGRPRQLCGIASDVTEQKVAEEELRLRNAELCSKNDELERFNRAMVNRELRMIELKQEINTLLQQAGQPPRYRVETLLPDHV